MYAGQDVTSGSPGCLLAVPGDQKAEGRGDSTVEGLFSFFSLFSSPPPPRPAPPQKKILDLPRLGKMARIPCLAPEHFMALSSPGCEAPSDMSPLAPRPGRAHPSSPAGGRVWERPCWRGCHLLPSLSLRVCSRPPRRLRWGRARGGPLSPSRL